MSIVIWFTLQSGMARRQLQQPCVIQILRSSIAERIVFDAGVKPIYLSYRVVIDSGGPPSETLMDVGHDHRLADSSPPGKMLEACEAAI